jgi:hypothetical protein
MEEDAPGVRSENGVTGGGGNDTRNACKGSESRGVAGERRLSTYPLHHRKATQVVIVRLFSSDDCLI